MTSGSRHYVLVYTEGITGYRHCVLVEVKQISGQIAGESGQNYLLIMWIGLWSLRVSRLTVIIILIVEEIYVNILFFPVST